MPRFVALLRAVNVGKRQVKMAELRAWLESDGFTDVETYIQTGNVRVATTSRSSAKVEERLERVLAEGCGFEVPCIVLTPHELSQMHADARAIPPPFGEAAGQRRYVVFFKDPVAADAAARMAEYAAPTERIWAGGRAVHVWIAGPSQQAKVFGVFAKALAPGTSRDLKVVAALDERWGAGARGGIGSGG